MISFFRKIFGTLSKPEASFVPRHNVTAQQIEFAFSEVNNLLDDSTRAEIGCVSCGVGLRENKMCLIVGYSSSIELDETRRIVLKAIRDLPEKTGMSLVIERNAIELASKTRAA